MKKAIAIHTFMRQILYNFFVFLPWEIVVLGKLQQDEVARNNFKALLEMGIYPDMAARMIIYDMKYPKDFLCERFLAGDEMLDQPFAALVI